MKLGITRNHYVVKLPDDKTPWVVLFPPNRTPRIVGTAHYHWTQRIDRRDSAVIPLKGVTKDITIIPEHTIRGQERVREKVIRLARQELEEPARQEKKRVQRAFTSFFLHKTPDKQK